MRNKKLEIYFDMDGVLANLDKKVIDIANKEFKMDYDYTKNNSYWWSDTGIDKEFFEELLLKEGLFYELDPVDGMIDLVNKLKSEGYDVYILTMPQLQDCYDCKARWLKKHFSWINIDKHLIATGNKKLLAKPHRILIDDNARFLQPWSQEGGIAIGFGGKSWTLDFKGHQINSADEIYKLIKIIDKGER